VQPVEQSTAPARDAAATSKPGTGSGVRRIEWIDVARGIGIVLVVYGHVLRGLAGAGMLDQASPLWLSDYAIYTFHMPLFFFLAGLNVERSIAKGKMAFLRAKLWTIAYPYLLWSAIQGSIQILLPGYVNRQRSLLFLVTIWWIPIAQFWFLYSLFVCHMVALIVGRKRWLLAILGIGAYCLSVFKFWQPTTTMFGFYVAGIFLGRLIYRWIPSVRVSAAGVVCSAFIFAIAEHFGRSASGGATASIFSLPATVSGILLVCFVSQWIVCTSEWWKSMLTWLGVMSMTIYILHLLAATGARIILVKLGLVKVPEQLLIGVAAGIGLPILAHLVFKRLNLLTALGLAPLRPSTSRVSADAA
jgi:fucose 4-O-acetylase-like acetyltransferase